MKQIATAFAARLCDTRRCTQLLFAHWAGTSLCKVYMCYRHLVLAAIFGRAMLFNDLASENSV